MAAIQVEVAKDAEQQPTFCMRYDSIPKPGGMMGGVTSIISDSLPGRSPNLTRLDLKAVGPAKRLNVRRSGSIWKSKCTVRD